MLITERHLRLILGEHTELRRWLDATLGR